MATEWMDNLLNQKISKEAMEAVGTDAKDTFERKVKAHDWINSVTELDPVQVEAEYREKLKQEAMVLGKTAALDDIIADGVTPEETINRDYKRDVSSLSDYALAEMLAEARGHKAQNTSEMFYELKEKAKAEVASSREKAEKALLDLIPESSMLDWQKAFKEFTKERPAEAKEKDLFRTDVPEKAHDFEHPSEEKFKLPKEAEKAIPGNGREADERKEVTQEAGVLQKDIVAGTSKEASLKVEAKITMTRSKGGASATGDYDSEEDLKHDIKLYEDDGWKIGKITRTEKPSKKHADVGSAPMSTGPDQNDAVVREGFKQMCEGAGEEIILDLLMQYMPVDAMQEMLNDFSDEGEWVPGEEHYEHAGVPMAVSSLKQHLMKKASGCPVCGSEGKDLNNDQKEHLACEACGLTYARASLVKPTEIKSHASKADVIKIIKQAEVQSPWQVIVDPETGAECVARISTENKTVKESEEIKPDELLK